MENKCKSPEQEKVNAVAEKYCAARAAGNDGQMKKYLNEIIIKLCEKNAPHKILLTIFRKLNGMKQSILCVSSYEDLMGYVFEFLHESMDKYDYNENPNFCAWFVQGFFWKLNKIASKDMTTKGSPVDENGKPIPRLKYTPVSPLPTENDDDSNSITFNIPTEEPAYEKNDDEIAEMRVKLISTYTLFYERKKGKAANETKHEYYRIFVTEALINDVREHNSLVTYNKQEIMQVTDGGFVRFVAFTKFEKAEDFITMKIKRYSDIFENGEKKELKLDHEARVIIEYRFVNGFDKKRVSAAAVSQQLSSFKEDMRAILSE